MILPDCEVVAKVVRATHIEGGRTMKARLFTLLSLVVVVALPLSGGVQSGSLASAASPDVAIADAQNVELVGHIGGPTYAVAVQGNYAHIGEGYSLTILDISDPASPIVVGKTFPLPDIVQGVAIAGGYAYVADGDGGLRVINVSTPTNPVEVGFYDTPGHANGVAVVGSYAYIADGGSGLRVINVSTPTNPTEVGFYDTPGSAYGVAVAGGYAYVADGYSGGLQVVDVSNPADPTGVGFYDTPGVAKDVTIAGGYAYVADYYGGLRVVDVSTPTNPTEVGFYNTPGVAYDVAVAGDYAYVADSGSGLRVINISTPTNPTEVGSYSTPGDAQGVAIAGGYAFVVDGSGLRVINVSAPMNPIEVGFYDAPEYANSVAVAGNYAYVTVQRRGEGCWGGGLKVVTVSMPTNPVEAGSYDLADCAEDLTIAEGYAYVADGNSGLRVIDVLTPTNPLEVGFYDTPGHANGVAVVGSYAYIADGGSGLRVVNVSTPTNPTEVGFYDTSGYAYGVAVTGSYAYVAEGGGETLRVIDVSIPSNPTEVGSYDTQDARGVAVAGGYAYVADGDGGLRVINVSTPTSPTEVGFYDTPGSANGVAVDGGYTYVADGDGGLFILRYTGGPMGLTSGSMALSVLSTFLVDEALAGNVWVHNTSSQSQSYTIIIRLQKAGTDVDVQTDTFTIPAGRSAWRAFDFGTQESGSYQLTAELWADDALLRITSQDVDVVLSIDQRQAKLAAQQMTRSALREFQQAQDIVVWAYGESVSALPAEAVDFFVGGKLLELITPVGEAALVPYSELSKAGYEVSAKIGALDEVLEATSRPAVERVARKMTDARMFSARRQVESRRQQFDDYVLTHDISWTREMWNLTDRYIEGIESRVEQEYFRGFAPPPIYIWPHTTLPGEELSFRIYQGIGKFLGWLGILATIAVMIWAIVGTLGGAIPAVIAALAELKPLVSGLKPFVAIVLVVLSLVMNFQTEHILAPRIMNCHNQGLDELEDLMSSTGTMGSADVDTQVNVRGLEVYLTATVTNADDQAAQPVLRTDLYSLDSRLVEMLVGRPRLAVPGIAVLENEFGLPPGRYRAVTIVDSAQQHGLSSDVNVFEIVQPQVDLVLHIAQPQLAISQTLQASVDITNTTATSGTSELGLLITSSDGENVKVQRIDLAAEASHHTDFSFVPPAEGSYVLRAIVIDEQGNELAVREAGYVVGSGPALGIDVEYQPEYDPGVDVRTIITATNAGNQAVSSTLSLVVVNRETTQTVHTQTLQLDLAAGAVYGQEATVLPNAQPGQYQVNLLLDGTPHRTYSFLVAAEDRLWATVSVNPLSPELGQLVTLTVRVANATYTDTNASVTATVIDPILTDHVVTMSQVNTGTYYGTYTPVLSGTYEALISAERPNWRGAKTQTSFTTGQPSMLLPIIKGSPQVGQTRQLTVTVQNERGLRVPDASVTISGTNELLYRETDTAGMATFYASPLVAIPYQIKIQKMGYADTSTTLEVEPFALYLPLVLRSH